MSGQDVVQRTGHEVIKVASVKRRYDAAHTYSMCPNNRLEPAFLQDAITMGIALPWECNRSLFRYMVSYASLRIMMSFCNVLVVLSPFMALAIGILVQCALLQPCCIPICCRYVRSALAEQDTQFERQTQR